MGHTVFNYKDNSFQYINIDKTSSSASHNEPFVVRYAATSTREYSWYQFKNFQNKKNNSSKVKNDISDGILYTYAIALTVTLDDNKIETINITQDCPIYCFQTHTFQEENVNLIKKNQEILSLVVKVWEAIAIQNTANDKVTALQ